MAGKNGAKKSRPRILRSGASTAVSSRLKAF